MSPKVVITNQSAEHTRGLAWAEQTLEPVQSDCSECNGRYVLAPRWRCSVCHVEHVRTARQTRH
jgi:hypothetical protein